MSGADYQILVRDLSTLEVVGEVPVYRNMTWQRRDLEAGSFSLTVPRQRLVTRRVYDADEEEWSETSAEESYGDLIALGRLIEVRRDDGDGNECEFAGVITDRALDAIRDQWTLTGPDLKGWFLERRIVGATVEETVAATAGETAMKGYVDDHGGTSGHPFAGELDVDWDIEADTARGPDVDFTALRRNLLREVLVPIGRQSDLWHDVVIVEDGTPGYEYRVYEQTDATLDTGAIPFSVSWDNVAAMTYRESIRGVANDLTVLGDGSGDSRTTRNVTDTSHINAHGRTEGLLDARDATTNDEIDEQGATAIADGIREAVQVTAEPLQAGVGSVYRRDWDIGRVVTVAIADEAISADRLIVGVEVVLESSGGRPDERVRMFLGDAEQTLPRVLARQLQARNRASYE
ncbi:MAG: siphovirus ReqiPepy6 Gp37-like family protein [Dehalococcoidia bacterium]|nr:siphovirus ReqiPepy6 Gp37-like family protein [Dehalococcoidia bacterium]